MFETRSEKVYSLNPSGAAIVREIVSGTEEPQIAERLRSRFRDGQNKLAADIKEFLAEMRRRGLVED